MRWICLVTLVCGAALGATDAEAQVRIKLGTLAPAGSSYHQILLQMRERLRACPDDGIHLTIYPGGVLGSESDHVRKMRIGQISAALLTAAGLADIDPSVNALQKMPMMFHSFEELDFVRHRLEPVLGERLGDKGFVVLFWGDAGWIRFFSREPAMHPDDFKRMKMFVGAGEADEIDLMRKAGQHVVPLELSDMLTALKTGMIDVVPTVPFHALAGQLFTVTGNMLELNWVPLVGAAVLTRDVWDRLTPSTRSCLVDAAREAGAQIKARGREENDEAVEAMQRKHGLQVHTVPPALAATWREQAERYYPDIRGSIVPADIFDQVRTLVAEYRASASAAR